MNHPAPLATIARTRQRGLLVLSFFDHTLEARLAAAPPGSTESACRQWMLDRFDAWKNLPARQQIMDWLQAQGMAWQPCAPFLPGWVIPNGATPGGYRGDIYLDIACDKSLLIYRALLAYLQYPDGTMRLDHVTLFLIPAESALLCTP